jgi:hypothetical protein
MGIGESVFHFNDMEKKFLLKNANRILENTSTMPLSSTMPLLRKAFAGIVRTLWKRFQVKFFHLLFV